MTPGRMPTSQILRATSSKPFSISLATAECWVNETVDLSPWVGQTIRVKFLVHQDGFGDLTGMFVDEVQVTLPGPCAPTRYADAEGYSYTEVAPDTAASSIA